MQKLLHEPMITAGEKMVQDRRRVLKRGFYTRCTLLVAKEMLGKTLVCGPMRGRIVETEAYLGPEDLASHARFQSRKRNYLMFGAAGIIYVYRTYGMYDMLNIIAKEEGKVGAVLIRAIEPLTETSEKTDGPGKLTRALEITRDYNGSDVTHETLFLEENHERIREIVTTPRIGIDYAGAYRDKPWRFLFTKV